MICRLELISDDAGFGFDGAGFFGRGKIADLLVLNLGTALFELGEEIDDGLGELGTDAFDGGGEVSCDSR